MESDLFKHCVQDRKMKALERVNVLLYRFPEVEMKPVLNPTYTSIKQVVVLHSG